MTATTPAAAGHGQLNERGVRGFGLELVLDLAGCDLAAIDSRDELAAYLEQLVEKIDMTAYGAPHLVRFGEGELAGWTGIQLITTSSITMHLAPADRTGYVNIFSCKVFDPAAATEFTVGFFGARQYTARVLERTAPKVEA
jgi:S-adenosylmethionine/arginine decarboxylase-like enzyme